MLMGYTHGGLWPSDQGLQGVRAHHDPAILSKPAMPQRGFRFDARRTRIDWRALHGVDINKLVSRPSQATTTFPLRWEDMRQSWLKLRGACPANCL